MSLLTATLLFINCSKDDDNKLPIETTGLFGTWVLDYYINDGQLVEEILCNEQVTYVFSSDGTYTKTTHSGDGSTNCVVAVIINGVWENLGNDQYKLSPNGSNINENLDITFQDNFTKFTIEYSDTYIEVYTKK